MAEKIATKVTDLIGHTPLVEIKNTEKRLALHARILAKLEYFNPAGSVKDRIAKAMIDDGIKTGKIKKDSVIIEPTSGVCPMRSVTFVAIFSATTITPVF